MNGYVAPGFEEVREVFAENFERRGELGASCAVVRDGESVVDIWGGHTNRERTQPWEADTLVLVYSLSKGISGLAAAIAHSRGCLDFDAAVTEVWPEFAAAGKQDVTIRQLLSEQAGLAAIETRLDPDAMRDPIALAAVLAAQTPEWTPGAWAGNHALTIGWIVSELIRRTDPAGRTLGRFVADEIATPLGAEFHFGLPEGFDQSRIARIDGWNPLRMLLHLRTLPWQMVFGMLWPWSLVHRTLNNPSMLRRGPAGLDVPAYWAVENGGAGGLSNARAIATIYGDVASGGGGLGLSPETMSNLTAPAPRPTNGWRDKVLTVDMHYSLGLEKPFDGDRFGSDDRAFGTFALGGSFAFADPATKVGYAYTTNKLGFYRWADPREKLVRDAVFQALNA